jgi:hypothetical protein
MRRAALFMRNSRPSLHSAAMQRANDDRTAAAWRAVHALVERWADLPPDSWRTLIDAERLVPVKAPIYAPDALDQWVVRDLVETAWCMATRHQPHRKRDWEPTARDALARLAWRLLDPREASTPRDDARSRRRRHLRTR